MLYYNSGVWHLDTHQNKQLLLSASAKAIKVELQYPDPYISYVQLHHLANKATPIMQSKYKLSL
jgi:hypothetical protein